MTPQRLISLIAVVFCFAAFAGGAVAEDPAVKVAGAEAEKPKAEKPKAKKKSSAKGKKKAAVAESRYTSTHTRTRSREVAKRSQLERPLTRSSTSSARRSNSSPAIRSD